MSFLYYTNKINYVYIFYLVQELKRGFKNENFVKFIKKWT